ncbi:MAG: hypothetical protein KBD83_03995 [Gammaproteobacteria bacterium]|jgi:hypothetical protein|nr:hypothetical protein [Gammaproteobacteria bacterium]
MGWLSSAWDSVCSFTSGVCSVAKDVFVGVASVASGVLSLARVLPLPPQIEAFFLAVQVIDIVCKALGLLEADETNEDFGGRVLQAEETGIHPEEYPTYLEYVAAIRNVELDPEKSAKYKPEEKMAAGLGVQYWGLEERVGAGTGELLTMIVKDGYNDLPYFTERRISNMLKVDSVANLEKYFSGKLNADDHNSVEQKLVDAERSLSPEKSNIDIYQELDARRELE